MDLYESYPSCSLLKNTNFDSLLSAFEEFEITTADLVVNDPKVIAQRCGRSQVELLRFLNIFYKEALNGLEFINIGELQDGKLDKNTACLSGTSSSPLQESCISTRMLTTGDSKFDSELRGGIPAGYITEVSGESGSGKSNFLTQLCVTVQLPKALGGLEKSALYICTESGFETRRLIDMIEYIKQTHSLNESQISSDNVHCINCRDQEHLEQVLKYQLPVAIERFNVGILLIDSIAAHLRAEFDLQHVQQRNNKLILLSRHLRKLASLNELAVVIANQVSDRFIRNLPAHSEPDALFLDHQIRWFSGWEEPNIVVPPSSSFHSSQQSTPATTERPRTPSLGLAWSNCIDQRIVLKRALLPDGSSHRTFNIVFSPFSPQSCTPFKIMKGGVYSIDT
ncbi:putative DNA-dependent ATPase RAD57 [Sugiyamaella lignohabitans]|uniref:Putative DNA-dependent ATPase RAD57 n=1 Tax=Sugiyamaella lignohabitans TaxID=796027 RepID=A0A167ET09_9ASCO|nr:putative DNA-dependent ATPase RAD57 [Sugiyamaella lignohabitans]ANB14419.1 putative DNA-dependent ATPase RAD57 [Sugiyamaella lignohabitans]